MVMTGGGSLIRHFPELISNATHLKVTLAENPLESVVKGAGLALDQLDVLRKLEELRDNKMNDNISVELKQIDSFLNLFILWRR